MTHDIRDMNEPIIFEVSHVPIPQVRFGSLHVESPMTPEAIRSELSKTIPPNTSHPHTTEEGSRWDPVPQRFITALKSIQPENLPTQRCFDGLKIP